MRRLEFRLGRAGQAGVPGWRTTTTLRLDAADAARYAAVHVVGGKGAMFDRHGNPLPQRTRARLRLPALPAGRAFALFHRRARQPHPPAGNGRGATTLAASAARNTRSRFPPHSARI